MFYWMPSQILHILNYSPKCSAVPILARAKAKEQLNRWLCPHTLGSEKGWNGTKQLEEITHKPSSGVARNLPAAV